MTTLSVDAAAVRGSYVGIEAANLERASKASLYQIYQQIAAAHKGEPVADSFVSVLNQKKTALGEAGFLGRLYESVVVYVQAKVEWLKSAVDKVFEPIKGFQAEIDKRIGTQFERILGEEGAELLAKAASKAV
ncbi:MAG: hypothetical protein K2X66_12215 [Cyanobacteria bacterium]|nr:hypothetical protein [Cyanobacteriota bacterium]